MNNILEAKGLRKSYLNGDQELHVLKGIDLSIREGEILSIVGPSGAGKSTLLYLLGALSRPTAGVVYFKGSNVYEFDEENLAKFRNENIGFVFQFHHLLPEFTALENVMMPGLIAKRDPQEVKKSARRILTEVGLESKINYRPGELSGGEQQRVAVARALVNGPAVVLADELTGNLDRKTGEIIHELIWQLNRLKGQTFVLVTHNEELARRADRIIRLIDGRIVN